MTDQILCLQCESAGVVRYGKATSGRQKYKCRNCGRQFVPDPGNRRIDEETKRVVLQLLSEGVAPAKIKSAYPGVSLRWIYTQKKRLSLND